MTFRLSSAPRLQCEHCPCRKRTNPNGYSPIDHAALRSTIADPGRMILGGPLRVMACHETPPGAERPCVGWLTHQVGVGNNIALRLAVIHGQVDANVQTVGPQHERFEDTLTDAVREALL